MRIETQYKPQSTGVPMLALNIAALVVYGAVSWSAHMVAKRLLLGRACFVLFERLPFGSPLVTGRLHPISC